MRLLKKQLLLVALLWQALGVCGQGFTNPVLPGFHAEYYTSVENNFNKTMDFIAKNDLLERFKPRLKQCVEWASPCGWGFADTIADIYYEYFPEEL